MVTPGRYVELRNSFPIVEVQFGCGGIYLFPLTELESGQVGYSVSTNGTPLEGERDGEWRPSWLAIGYETALETPSSWIRANRHCPFTRQCMAKAIGMRSESRFRLMRF